MITLVYSKRVKAGFSEEKLSLMPCQDTFECFVLDTVCSKAKQLRFILRHGKRPDFLEINFL